VKRQEILFQIKDKNYRLDIPTKGYSLQAQYDEIGKIKDVLFDNRQCRNGGSCKGLI
jgi:hypothetical protein